MEGTMEQLSITSNNESTATTSNNVDVDVDTSIDSAAAAITEFALAEEKEEDVEEEETGVTGVLAVDDDDSDVARCIRLGSAAAIRDAIAMKRSDSDLSKSTDDFDDDEEEDTILLQQGGQLGQESDMNSATVGHVTGRSLSSLYMEESSIEAEPRRSSLDDNDDNDQCRRLQLKPSGRMGMMANRRMSSLGIINVDVLVGGADDDSNSNNIDGTSNNCAVDNNSEDKSTADDNGEDEMLQGNSSFGIFHTNMSSIRNMRTLTPTETDDNDTKNLYEQRRQEEKNYNGEGKHEGDGDSDSADKNVQPQPPDDELCTFELSELLAECGMDTISIRNNNTNHEHSEISKYEKDEQDIHLLHALFGDFCRPPLEINSVKEVVESEKRRRNQHNNGDDDDDDDLLTDVVLPIGAVIQRPSTVLIKLLTTPSYLQKLPQIFASSIFRIFLRLLEGYTDFQYNYVILASSPWKEEAFLPSSVSNQKRRKKLPRRGSSEKIFVGTTDDATTNANLMYSIVRLRMVWKNSVQSMLFILKSILCCNQHHQRQQHHHHKYEYLLSPITRLIGILCAGGVAVDELRQMISLACDVTVSLKVRLSMVRALSVSASSAASRSSFLVLGRTNPMNFFSFISGPGIKRTINLDQTSWPFRNDFGTAFNFRAEDFSSKESNNCVLLQALNESGSGFEIHTIPLPKKTKQCNSAAVLAIKVIENHRVETCIKVNNCPLHARVWYHVAVRHTRSRLKGVFSLSSREQLTVLIDGKIMLTEAMKFPQIRHDSSIKKTLSLTFGENFDGQVGSIYIFHDNISDATFKAIFEMTSETKSVGKTGHTRSEMKSNHQEVPGRNIEWDDLEHLAVGQCVVNRDNNVTRDVADLGEDKEIIDGGSNPLSKSSFISRLYITWNPRRRENNFLMELHSGAHVLLNDQCVQAVCIEGSQQVIGSIGGIQSLFTILWSMLGERRLEINGTKDIDTVMTYSLVPDLLNILSCFVRGNNQNARELLRCGGIDIVEHLLFQNKAHPTVRSLFTFPSLSKLLVQILLDLQSSCSHYIALERKVFSRLLFNIPLWFEGLTQEAGVSLYSSLLPILSSIVQTNPTKVRSCVGAKDMIWFMREIIETKSIDNEQKAKDFFKRDPIELDLPTRLTSQERQYLIDTLLAWIFHIFLIGSSMDDMSALMRLLSNYLEYEWNETAKEISEGNQNGRSLHREERYLFTQKASTIFLHLMETSPPRMIENVARICGGIDGGVAWLLSAFVNSYCDLIRSIGIKCVGAYVRASAHGPDLPLSFSLENLPPLDRRKKMIGGSGNIQENTISLISNVSQGFLKANDKSGETNSSSRLTPSVIYKLLWHLIKSHRYRMGAYTQAALVSLVFERKDAVPPSQDLLISHLITTDKSIPFATKVEFNRAKFTMAESSIVDENVRIRDTLSMNTILRVLRFLPSEYSSRWLRSLVDLSRTSNGATTIASCPDWQPCLFQFVSEITENLASTLSSQNIETEKTDSQQERDSCQAYTVNGSNKGFELSLELYSILLGHIIRNDSEKSIVALEETAALQRVFVNGSEVFALILSHIFPNLFENGVTSFDQKQRPKEMDTEESEGAPSVVLKYTAKIVTDAILSNGARGMNLSAAATCWRFLKYLVVSTTAFVTSLGSSSEYHVNSTKDSVTGGVLGILLSEGGIGSFQFEEMMKIYAQDNLLSEGEGDAKGSKFTTCVHENFVQRICVHIAAQMLSLLDVFIFPEDSSLDLSTTSQLHGLALVRGTETQIGTAQGPFLVSLMRVSLLLLNRLEPCSVKMLQCCGRLRCFAHYSLELVRESEAMERYSMTFNKIALPFDRLLLSSFVRSHFALQKCNKLLHEIESNPSSTIILFTTKEAQKKCYRRLFRVTIELREILMTIHGRRNALVRNALTREAMNAFQSCMESPIITDGETGSKVQSHKEVVVRALLASDFVGKFEMSLSRVNDTILLVEERGFDMLADEYSFTQELRRDASEIENSFQKSLNGSFEEYLEKQRRWAETGAVRDLEFEGDTMLKKLSSTSSRCKNEDRSSPNIPALTAAAERRWKAIDKKVGDAWYSPLHWKLPIYNDQKGRRVVLVSNPKFDSHDSASYELMLGLDREREERHRKERMLQNELSDLMKRNSEAIVPYDESLTLEDENEDDPKAMLKTKEDSELASIQRVVEPSHSEDLPEIQLLKTDMTAEESASEGFDTDGDNWARAFIWHDGESIVARFEKVMVVTLRYLFDGHLLLTTEGLYFHQVDDGINVITKEPCPFQKNNRRWLLSRLTDVGARRYMLRTQALELFFADGHEIFLNFLSGQKERNRFYAKLRNSCKIPMIFSPKSLNPRVVFKKSKVTEQWIKRKISNFDYLMALNRMAGRTFNDISQYPVFPWILADYQSEKVDLSDSRSYRDLSKPVGALNPSRLAMLLERYQELESFGFPPEEKFLYGSHYSSPGLILHFLIRQEPFTSMAIDLQSGKFDCPDRLFFDLKESWKSCNTSSSDVKELIPEFFTMPEMLLNLNNFPFGKTQKGRSVNDVDLPPWAKGSAHEFVRIHRLALESEYVSCNLQNWIDLVFGYKQRGLEAEKAWNIFHHLSYEGSVDLDKINDDIDRKAAESQIQNFGQTPSQLILKNPHPSRYGLEISWRPLIFNIATPVRLRCHTPSQQFGRKIGHGGGAVACIHIKADALIVVYSDLKVGFFRWSPKSATNRLQPDKLQSLPSRDMSYSRSVMKRGSAVPQTVGERTSQFAVGNYSFAVTIGGYEKEQLRRRNTVVHSRLASAKDALYTDTVPLLVSCGYWDNTIKVHSTDGWKLESSDGGGHRGPIRCLAIGADGGLLVTGGEDCTCRVWVVDFPEMAMAISDGFTQTVLGNYSREDQILAPCHILLGHESAISCVAISSELGVTISGSIRGKICIHTLRTGEFVRSFSPSANHDVPVTKIALEEHGRMVIQIGDRRLYTYTVNGTCLCSVDAEEQIHDMKITGEVVVTGGEKGHVYIRNLATLKILSGLNLSKHGPIRCVSFTPANLNPLPQFLFIGSDNGMISIVEQHDE